MAKHIFTKLQTKYLGYIVKKTIYPLIESPKYKEGNAKKYSALEIAEYTLALADYKPAVLQLIQDLAITAFNQKDYPK